MTEKRGFFIKSGYFLQDYWPRLLSIISTVSFLFSSCWFAILFAEPNTEIPLGKTRFCIGIIFIILYVIGECSTSKTFAYTASLKKEKEQLEQLVRLFGNDYPAIWRTRLGVIANEFGFSFTERVSVYKPDNGIFMMLGRFAEDPELNRAGRGEYPSNQGCIQRAYREGKAIVMDLADPNVHPEKYYEQMERDWKIPRDIMEQRRMKSRSYAAFSLTDETGLNKLAVIVFESTKENGLDAEALERGAKGIHGETLIRLMKVLKTMEPSVSLPKQLGM